MKIHVRTVTPEVAGSSPVGPAKKNKPLGAILRAFDFIRTNMLGIEEAPILRATAMLKETEQ